MAFTAHGNKPANSLDPCSPDLPGPPGPHLDPASTTRPCPVPGTPPHRPLLERLCPSFTHLYNKLYLPHWPASAHLHLTLAPEDFMSSLPNCLRRNRLPSLAAGSMRVRSTRVCPIYIYIYEYIYIIYMCPRPLGSIWHFPFIDSNPKGPSLSYIYICTYPSTKNQQRFSTAPPH